jgi:hypothetical protein
MSVFTDDAAQLLVLRDPGARAGCHLRGGLRAPKVKATTQVRFPGRLPPLQLVLNPGPHHVARDGDVGGQRPRHAGDGRPHLLQLHGVDLLALPLKLPRDGKPLASGANVSGVAWLFEEDGGHLVVEVVAFVVLVV